MTFLLEREREIIGDEGESEIDEDDPSEAWVSQSLSESGGHMPLGPLGQEKTDPKSPTLSRNPSRGGGIEIKAKKQRKAAGLEKMIRLLDAGPFVYR